MAFNTVFLKSYKQFKRVLDRIQRGFENQFNQYSKIKKEDINAIDYDTLQAWTRIQRHVIVDDEIKDGT